MSRRGRGSTGPGRVSVRPDGDYAAPPAVRQWEGGLVVEFAGDDGRHESFDFGRLPAAGWHEFLAEAFALRIGPSGGLRTLASALNCWRYIVQWTHVIQGLGEPAGTPEKLSQEHVKAFFDDTEGTLTARYGLQTAIRTLFSDRRLAGRIPEPAMNALTA